MENFNPQNCKKSKTFWVKKSEYLKTNKGSKIRETKYNKSLRLLGILYSESKIKPVIKDTEVIPKSTSNEEESLIKVAKNVSKQMNLPIVMVAFCHYWNIFDVDYVYRYQSPANFLWLLDNASFVVTNSFHGVAFSINFEKQFLVCKRKKYNIRLDSILEILDLKDRYVGESNFSDESIAINEIDYDHINALKDKYVKSSIEFLSNAIGE